MRRRDLSDEELTTVINLKRAGTSWVKVQAETGINRRTAKRAYDNWEHSKSMGELKEARKDVAAKALFDHLNSLTILAGSLVTSLSVPFFLADMEKNAEQFSSWLFEQDLLQRHISPETQVHVYTMGETQCFYVGGDTRSYRREKELLFESLKAHTREEVRWKDILDTRWNEARDNCAKIVPKLRKETSEVINNFLNQERETNFLQRVKEESREDDPAKRIAEVMLREIWRAILRDKLHEETPWFQTVLRGKGIPQEINVKSKDEMVLIFYGDTNMGLAKGVTRICNLACNNLCKGNTVRQLHDEVGKMEKASEELREMLNPVKLRPMILRTRCDLCPC
jgi:hypothetical protein